eukprot:GHVH01014218.1.p1 GENE.GHVH01014218.1~~GHVH01014218.1.p1  ORF type:complete len:406 (+),score=73.31 GHVH01014218.1:132-1349(+)
MTEKEHKDLSEAEKKAKKEKKEKKKEKKEKKEKTEDKKTKDSSSGEKKDKKDKKEKKDKKHKKDKKDKLNSHKSSDTSLPFPNDVFDPLDWLTVDSVLAMLPADAVDSDLQGENKYRGEWKQGQPCGWGVISYKGGAFYYGQINSCSMEGYGIYVYPSGALCKGFWEAGKLNSYSVFLLADGSTEYRGVMAQDKRCGLGMEVEPDDTGRYIGMFEKGIKDGRGRSIIGGDHSFVGFYNNNAMLYGFYRFPSGSYYIGQFELDQMSGMGTMYYINGTKYVGKWVQGKQQGLGIMYKPEGGIDYSGYWRDNKRHGRGFVSQPGNQMREAQFIDGSRSQWHSPPISEEEYLAQLGDKSLPVLEGFLYVPYNEAKYGSRLIDWIEDDFRLCHEDQGCMLEMPTDLFKKV